jgi:transposase
MVWQPKRLTAAQREERRLAAGRLLRTGRLSQAEIARQMGVSEASVTRWKHRLMQGGMRGLHHRRPPGRPSRLSATQWRQLFRRLRRGAQAAGFETERGTRRRIAQVVEREFGVPYQFRALGPALRARGWRPQQPVPRATSASSRSWQRGSSGTGHG